MTAIEPAPQIMVSRQLAPVETQTVAMAQMDAEFRMAQAIARAGDMLPRAYRDKPGAVILVNQWAKARGLDILTAMQNVSFIEGKPVVDATMQRALAEDAGYEVRVPDDRCNLTSAAVEVWRDGVKIGEATYTWDEAVTAQLVGKPNWKKNPADMLVARATTRALKRHAPKTVIGMADPDEAYDTDPVAVLAPATGSGEVIAGSTAAPVDPAADPPAVTVTEVASPDVVDAEVIEEPAEAPKMTLTDLETAVKVAGVAKAEVIRHAQSITPEGVDLPSSLGKILATPEVLPQVMAWLETQGTDAEAPF